MNHRNNLRKHQIDVNGYSFIFVILMNGKTVRYHPISLRIGSKVLSTSSISFFFLYDLRGSQILRVVERL